MKNKSAEFALQARKSAQAATLERKSDNTYYFRPKKGEYGRTKEPSAGFKHKRPCFIDKKFIEEQDVVRGKLLAKRSQSFAQKNPLLSEMTFNSEDDDNGDPVPLSLEQVLEEFKSKEAVSVMNIRKLYQIKQLLV